MVLIFDLDDTLYPEINFVMSGFKAVALWGQSTLKIDQRTSYSQMLEILNTFGRGSVFDKWLAEHNVYSRKIAVEAVQVYRLHIPHISLTADAKNILHKYSNFPLYLVTDGNKHVQARKIKALSLENSFKKIYVTHRYGVKHSKPSPYCFELIKNREQCNWSDMWYIGDNPQKDFVKIKEFGVKTVRVLTGAYSSVVASEEFDADTRIDSLKQLESLLRHGI